MAFKRSAVRSRLSPPLLRPEIVRFRVFSFTFSSFSGFSAIVDFARGKVLIRVGNSDYSADVIAGTRKNGSIILYDIINLQTESLQKKTGAAKSTNPSPGTARNTATIYEDMVAHGGDNVKQMPNFPRCPRLTAASHAWN